MNPVSPNAAHATEAPETITMYGADWCGDCLRAKAYFAEHEIIYDVVDLTEHEAGNDVVLARTNDAHKIPVIIFPDNSHLIEPTNADLDAKMAGLADASEFSVVENADEGRFELHRNGEILSIADFSERNGGLVVIPHVGTDPKHRGQGNAGRLMDGVLYQLRASNRKVLPLCPFAAQHINDNPRHQDLLGTQ